MAAACSGARRARALAYWREEEGDRRAPGGLGRQLGRPGGFGGCQVGIFSLCFLFFFLFHFATVLNSNIIQTSAKLPLNLFMLPHGLFQGT